jgi:hypothetical protein
MPVSSHFEGIFQCGKLNARGQLRRTREATTKLIQTGATTWPRNTLCTNQQQVEPGCKNLQTRLPRYIGSLDCQDYSRTHKP